MFQVPVYGLFPVTDQVIEEEEQEVRQGKLHAYRKKRVKKYDEIHRVEPQRVEHEQGEFQGLKLRNSCIRPFKCLPRDLRSVRREKQPAMAVQQFLPTLQQGRNIVAERRKHTLPGHVYHVVAYDR